MKNILLLLTFFVTSFTLAQAPPLPSMPTDDNKILIDELIKVTEFESYFNNYCKNKIDQAAKENNWDDKKRQEIIRSINFERFETNTIYNNFARNTKEDLEETISLIKKLNQKRNLSSTKLIISNLIMQNNLEGYVKALLKGDYIKKATH